MAIDRKPLLSLDTVAPTREFILIDSEPYELAMMTDFGLEARLRLGKYQGTWVRLEAMAALGREATDGDLADLQVMIREFTPMVIRGSTPEILAGLSEGMKLEILRVFCEAAGLMEPETTETPEVSRQTTETSSQGSNDSTEETPADG